MSLLGLQQLSQHKSTENPPHQPSNTQPPEVRSSDRRLGSTPSRSWAVKTPRTRTWGLLGHPALAVPCCLPGKRSLLLAVHVQRRSPGAQTVLPKRMHVNTNKTKPSSTPWMICTGNVGCVRNIGTVSDQSVRVRKREV